MMVDGAFARREGGFVVRRLRQLMLAELGRRNRAQTTIRTYLHRVSQRCRVRIRAMMDSCTAKCLVEEPV
jgi:hypothetical protein